MSNIDFHLDQGVANDFLYDVEEFSTDYLNRLGISENGSPNGGSWIDPKGAVLHYAVSHSAESVTRWLCDPSSRASAHYIIAQKRVLPTPDDDPEAQSNMAYRLPASIIRIRNPNTSAWHATWTNDTMLGIEMCNSGEIRFDAQGHPHIYHPTQGWKRASGPYVDNAIRSGGRTFCGYNNAQLTSLQLLLHALRRKFEFPLTQVYGHDMVQGRMTRGAGGHDKRDIGIAWDMEFTRAQVGRMNAESFWQTYQRAAAQCDAPPRFGYQSHFRPVGVDASSDWAMRCQAKGGSEQAACRLLTDLGYSLTRLPEQFRLMHKEQYAVFQRLMGLEPDGIMGPLTRAAVCTRHADRLSQPDLIVQGQLDG